MALSLLINLKKYPESAEYIKIVGIAELCLVGLNFLCFIYLVMGETRDQTVGFSQPSIFNDIVTAMAVVFTFLSTIGFIALSVFTSAPIV